MDLITAVKSLGAVDSFASLSIWYSALPIFLKIVVPLGAFGLVLITFIFIVATFRH